MAGMGFVVLRHPGRDRSRGRGSSLDTWRQDPRARRRSGRRRAPRRRRPRHGVARRSTALDGRRVRATDAASRRGFGRYWRVLKRSPPSSVAAGCEQHRRSARNGSTRRCGRGSGRRRRCACPMALPDAAKYFAFLALVAVTAIWGYTFVPVQKARRRLPALRIPRRPVRDLDGRASRRSPCGRCSAAAGRLGRGDPRGNVSRARLRAADCRPRADDGARARASSRGSTWSSRRCSPSPHFRTPVPPPVWVGVRCSSLTRPALPSGAPGGSWLGNVARARQRGRAVAADRRHGAVCAALRRTGADDSPDGRGVHGFAPSSPSRRAT